MPTSTITPASLINSVRENLNLNDASSVFIYIRKIQHYLRTRNPDKAALIITPYNKHSTWGVQWVDKLNTVHFMPVSINEICKKPREIIERVCDCSAEPREPLNKMQIM